MDPDTDGQSSISQGAFGLSPVTALAGNGPHMTDWRDNLERLMEEKGLDRKALSVRAGLDPSAVSVLLRDRQKRKDPQISTVAALAEALDVSLDTLFYGTVEAAPPIVTVPVVGQVAAGLWFEDGEWDTPRFRPVPMVPTRYREV